MSRNWTKIESETIDFLRPVMAFMVICLHVQFFYVDEQWSMSGGGFNFFVIMLCKVICPVAVPTFFFISGFLFFKGLEDWDKDVWKRKMIKRIRTLLVPFILWNLIALLAFPLTRFAGSVIKGVPMENVWYTIQNRGVLRLFWDRTLFESSFGQPMNTPLWFVRDLMVVVLLTPVIHCLIKKTGFLSVLVIAAFYLSGIWIPVSGFSTTAAFFFIWGSYYSIKRRSFTESFHKARVLFTILFFMGVLSVPFIWDKNPRLFSLTEKILIIITVVFCFGITSNLIVDKKVCVKVPLVKSSFFVYCSHMVIIASSVMMLVLALPTNSDVMRSVLYIAGVILIYLICHIIYLIMERFCPSILRVLSGGRN